MPGSPVPPPLLSWLWRHVPVRSVWHRPTTESIEAHRSNSAPFPILGILALRLSNYPGGIMQSPIITPSYYNQSYRHEIDLIIIIMRILLWWSNMASRRDEIAAGEFLLVRWPRWSETTVDRTGDVHGVGLIFLRLANHHPPYDGK